MSKPNPLKPKALPINGTNADADDEHAADAELVATIESEGIKRAADCLAVCDLMTTGLSMAQSCASVGIAHSTFLKCVSRSQSLGDKYTRAREILTDVLADDLLSPIDYDEFEGPDGKVDPGKVQLFRIQQDKKQWFLSKVNHRRYGDKLELSGDADNPIAVQRIERVVIEHALPDNADAIDV